MRERGWVTAPYSLTMAMPTCTGEGWPPVGDPASFPDGDGRHCCYVAGERCPNLISQGLLRRLWGRITRGNKRRYACGVVVEYGSWEAANTAPEYAPIGEFWVSTGHPWNYCEVFDPAECCRPEMKPEEALNGDLGT